MKISIQKKLINLFVLVIMLIATPVDLLATWSVIAVDARTGAALDLGGRRRTSRQVYKTETSESARDKIRNGFPEHDETASCPDAEGEEAQESGDSEVPSFQERGALPEPPPGVAGPLRWPTPWCESPLWRYTWC